MLIRGFLISVLLIFVECSVNLSVDPISEHKVDQVTNIPGQTFNVDFAHYAGYVTVNQEAGRALFSLAHWRRSGILGKVFDPCTEQHSTVYFNLPEVQNALHVYHSNTSRKWETSSNVVGRYWQDSPTTVLDVYLELISSGLRIWIFSGDTDAIIPVTSSRYSIDALNLTTISPCRAWYDDGQVGGRTQKYEGLTIVTVRGAGHEVPLHKPKQALTILKSFLAGTSLAAFEQVIESKTSASQEVKGF